LDVLASGRHDDNQSERHPICYGNHPMVLGRHLMLFGRHLMILDSIRKFRSIRCFPNF